MKCFYNNCEKEINERGKFCAAHDRQELEAASEVYAIFASAYKKKAA